MKISPYTIESETVRLSGIMPLLNGKTPEHFRLLEQEDADNFAHLSYAIDTLVFHVEIRQVNPEECHLRYWLEQISKDFALYSFGIQFQEISNLRAYLRNGYFSWDGSYYIQPEALEADWDLVKAEESYAMTQLLPLHGDGCLVIGFDRHERFQQRFRFNRQTNPCGLQIETLWDRAIIQHNRAESENLIFLEHAEIEAGLREWAKRLAAAARIPPRLSSPAISGWTSWYNLYAAINEANILEHLLATAKIVRQESLPMWVFQIDDGFTPEMGDWLDIKPEFPRGMKALIEDIRAAGFTAGLWIAPFVVGNRSRLYAEHPDWVVKARASGNPLVQMQFYGEFRWHKRSEEYYILDTTHPEAFSYLRQVFRTWRQEWGCEYIKTDFMHFGSEHGPETAQWHQSGLSRIEIWRQVAEMIREELGDALWLGCGFPLWAGIGLVDAVRIGRDMGVAWAGHYSAQSLLRDQASRNFANHILWQADPDCILIRESFHHLSAAELRSLALYAGMSGGLVMTSDKLDEVSAQRLKLWKLLLNPQKSRCHYPFLGQSPLLHQLGEHGLESSALDPILVQVRESLTDSVLLAVFILNTGDKALQRSYWLKDLGLHPPYYIYVWTQQMAYPEPLEAIHLKLDAHDGTLLFLSKHAITSEPQHLP